jgi:hypothetical protein
MAAGLPRRLEESGTGRHVGVMQHRSRNWLYAAGGIALLWFFEPFWKKNLEYYMEQRGWDRFLDAAVTAMPDWIGGAIAWLRLQGFWGGAFFVLVVWGCLEIIYAVQRKRRAAVSAEAEVPPRSEPGAPFDIVEDGGRISFDYSASIGRIQVGNVERQFVLRFTKASDTAIHLTKHGTNLAWVARVKDAPPGSSVDLRELERSLDNYTIGLGELFMAQNPAGYVVQGRIEHIADDARGAQRDELTFPYRIMLPPDIGAGSLRLKVLV